MTQDEYNKLTDDAQNALVATEVLGWSKGAGGVAWWLPDKYRSEMDVKDFDPKHNLDHAFMLVDKMEEDGFRWELYPRVIRLPYGFQLFKDFLTFKGSGETKNEAIMLACLKAKGVVE